MDWLVYMKGEGSGSFPYHAESVRYISPAKAIRTARFVGDVPVKVV